MSHSRSASQMEALPFLTNQILSFFIGLLKEKASSYFSQHDNGFPEINTKIDDILNMQERQLGMWVKAGLTHLQIGEISEARDEFIRAEASDKRNATAKLYLAMILAQTGKLDVALVKLREAITINPFIVILFTPDNLKLPGSFGKIAETLPQAWSCQLSDIRFTENLIDDNSILSNNWNQSTFHAMSLSGGLLVFSLRLHDASTINDKLFWGGIDTINTGFGERTLVCFDPNTGKLKWCVAMPDKELVFATPTYVVLKTEKAAYDFHETSNGIYSSSMGQEYFESIFFPGFATISKHKEYLRAIIRFLSEDCIFNDYANRCNARKKRLSLVKRLTGGEMEYSKEDFHSIEPPFSTANMGMQFIGTNQWRRDYVYRKSPISNPWGGYQPPLQLKAIFCNAMLSSSPTLGARLIS